MNGEPTCSALIVEEINAHEMVLTLKKRIRGHVAIPTIVNLVGLLLSSALDRIGPPQVYFKLL